MPHVDNNVRAENEQARQWYVQETIEQHWISRALERQVSALCYERLLSNNKKQPVLEGES